MKERIIEGIKYLCLFLIVLVILFALLLFTAHIPKESIIGNLEESIDYYKEHQGIDMAFNGREYQYLHYYADTILLNILLGIDTNDVLESVMWSKYYEAFKIDSNMDFISAVENGYKPNQQYMRYWHGSMAILRPLLTVFNMKQMYLINNIVLWGLAITLLILLFIKSKRLAIVFLISMIMISFYIVPFCFEYSWTFLIMFVVSIIAILTEKKGDAWLNKLFMITGMVTCFLDFLTTEIITIFVPLLFVLWIRKKENRLGTLKQELKFVIKSSVLWFVGYSGMWLAKWCLAGIITRTNPLNYVKDNLLVRINGINSSMSYKTLYSECITRNSRLLYPAGLTTDEVIHWWMVAALAIMVAICIDWNNLKGRKVSLLAFLIGLMPYARYIFLANHSYRHFFFTYRSQIITIIALLLIIIECFNYNLFNKIFRKKGKIKNE